MWKYSCLSLLVLLHLSASVATGTSSHGHLRRHHRSQHHHHHQQHGHCSEPDNLHELLQSLENSTDGQLPHSLPFHLPQFADIVHMARRQLQSQQSLTAFDESCLCREEDTADPCPVYHRVNTDIERHPRTLLEKDCCCREHTCTIEDQTRIAPTLHSSICRGVTANGHRARCAPIFYNVRVLRRTGCHNGVFQYREAWEPIKIGCSCKIMMLD